MTQLSRDDGQVGGEEKEKSLHCLSPDGLIWQLIVDSGLRISRANPRYVLFLQFLSGHSGPGWPIFAGVWFI
jgi:hypothetical protein